ncbi:MAG TPA: hypothetical protein VK979_05340 [Guyparkeria sp.]|nr:hypothetical protein [Guyparkeria sp.]
MSRTELTLAAAALLLGFLLPALVLAGSNPVTIEIPVDVLRADADHQIRDALLRRQEAGTHHIDYLVPRRNKRDVYRALEGLEGRSIDTYKGEDVRVTFTPIVESSPAELSEPAEDPGPADTPAAESEAQVDQAEPDTATPAQAVQAQADPAPAPAPAPQPEPKPQPDPVAEHIDLLQKRLDADQYLTPRRNAAIDVVRLLEAMDNPRAQKAATAARDRMSADYQRWSQARLTRGDLSTAGTYARRANKVSPGSGDPLLADIEAERQRLAAAEKPAEVPEVVREPEPEPEQARGKDPVRAVGDAVGGLLDGLFGGNE